MPIMCWLPGCQVTRLPGASRPPGNLETTLRSLRRNGAAALAFAVVLAALALTLAGVLAGAVVLVLLRRAAAFALAGVLARAAVVAGLAVAFAFTCIEAFTGILVGRLGIGGHGDGAGRKALVAIRGIGERGRVAAGRDTSKDTTENEITC